MSPYQIVIADDHALLRQGIRSIIETSEDMEVIGEASDGLELLNILKNITPHLV